MLKVIDAQFVTSAVSPEGYPPSGKPEVAMVGRSNVGKSSVINALTGRRKLARTSKTPGRTRTLNFYEITVDDEGTRLSARLVDFPGYGFAKVSKAEHRQWEQMVSRYLQGRDDLLGVFGVVDAEVGATAADQQMVSYIRATGRRIWIIATKVDRISKAKTKPRMLAISELLQIPLDRIFPFSAPERIGVEGVWRAVLPLLTKNPNDVGG